MLQSTIITKPGQTVILGNGDLEFQVDIILDMVLRGAPAYGARLLLDQKATCALFEMEGHGGNRIVATTIFGGHCSPFEAHEVLGKPIMVDTGNYFTPNDPSCYKKVFVANDRMRGSTQINRGVAGMPESGYYILASQDLEVTGVIPAGCQTEFWVAGYGARTPKHHVVSVVVGEQTYQTDADREGFLAMFSWDAKASEGLAHVGWWMTIHHHDTEITRA